jgi:hypothetical protein
MTEQIQPTTETFSPESVFNSINTIFNNPPEASYSYSLGDKSQEAQETKIFLDTFFEHYFGDSHLDLKTRSVSCVNVSSGEFESLIAGKLNNIFHLLNNPNVSSSNNTGLFFVSSADASGQVNNMTVFFSDGQSAMSGNEVAIYSISKNDNGLEVDKLS